MLLEKTVISGLFYDEEYARKSLPHIKSEYFVETAAKAVFKLYHHYFRKYGKVPTKQAILVEIENSKINQELYKAITQFLSEIEKENNDTDWLLDKTEEWCKERALYLAVYESIDILEGKSKDKGSEMLPEIFKDALSVTFDTHVGHDFLEDWEERYDEYQCEREQIPFNIKWLNDITGGGVEKKSLNVVVAGTGMGKSQFLCHLSASYLMDGLNVLYISMEMSEKKIASRIESNILDKDVEIIKRMTKDEYKAELDRKFLNIRGKLIVKEYPTGAANVGHFRYLLEELKQKKNFQPDVICVDYLGICSSVRIKSGNLYEMGKAIAEELRGLAVENDIPIWSAGQLNRGGLENTEITLQDVGESMGIAHTADFIFALSGSEDILARNQMIAKQLKNRYGDVNKKRKCLLGIDFTRSRFYDVEDENVDFSNPQTSEKFDGMFQ